MKIVDIFMQRNLKFFVMATIIGFILLSSTTGVYANHLTDSKLFKGTEELINDSTTALSAIVVTVSIAAVIYCQIRKAISDEMDHKKWDTRTSVGVIYAVIGISAKLLVDTIIKFYK